MNVVKGEHVVIFVNLLTGNLTPQDFGKNVLGVIGHGDVSLRVKRPLP
jgi:hypothetical protein